MKRPIPIQHEIVVGLDEMFFSTTDHRGVILDGNEVFVRISKYSREEIIGVPHNIIRHPDMPKIVFKTIWDTILEKKPVCGYVKNLAKDGSFYWVFATMIPVGEDFLSIRMKPTSHFKETIEALYKEILAAEKSSGVEASLKVLNSGLNSLGFSDYNSFGLAAISAELSGRNALQSKASHGSMVHKKASKEMDESHLGDVRESLFKIFNLITNLPTHTKAISEKIVKIGEVSKNIEFSSFNTIIEAERLGDDGRALSVIAEHITIRAGEAKKINSSIRSLTTKMLEVFGPTQLSVALATLQVEMLSCFIMQFNDDPLSMTEEGFKKNVSVLASQIEESLKNAKKVIESLGDDTYRISQELQNTTEILSTLDFIQKTGLIESARLSSDSIFSQLFISIMGLITDSRIIYTEFSEIINKFIKRDVDEAIRECESIHWDENKFTAAKE